MTKLPALVKICGLTRESDLAHVLDSGADRVGFVLVETSPRRVSFDRAKDLVAQAVEREVDAWVVIAWGGLSAKGQDQIERFIADNPNLGAVQVHGRETPTEFAEFVRRFPMTPIVKAIGVASKSDLERVEDFPGADEFLFDAKPPKGATREGGFGRSFDWSLLRGFDAGEQREWTLSGGLTCENVADAIKRSGATAVDVSSGVESAPGIKDAAKIAAFIKVAKSA